MKDFDTLMMFFIFLIVLTLGLAFLDAQDRIQEAREDKCPQSHNVYINGKHVGCTGDSTKYDGWYPGIETVRALAEEDLNSGDTR